MTARNDITGDKIQSRALSPQGQKNWELIFSKKTAQEWIDFLKLNLVIYDPDGWRYDDVTLETPITYKDFCYRLNMSTCLGSINSKSP